jgi:hypothetical protein
VLEPVLFTLGGMTMRKAGKSLSEPLPLRSCIAIMETSAKVGELLGAGASSAPPWRATMTGCGEAPQGLVRRRSPRHRRPVSVPAACTRVSSRVHRCVALLRRRQSGRQIIAGWRETQEGAYSR